MKIFAVYDKKAMCYFPPFTTENKIQAIRGLEQTVNSSGNVINFYPDDFALYDIGEFDNKTGRVTQADIIQLECECRQLVRPLRDVPAMPDHRDAELPSGKGAVNHD